MPLSREKPSCSTPRLIVRLAPLVVLPFVAALMAIGPRTTDTPAILVNELMTNEDESESESDDCVLVVESHYNFYHSRYGHRLPSGACFQIDTIHSRSVRGPPIFVADSRWTASKQGPPEGAV